MNEARRPPRFPLAGQTETHPLETVALWALGAAVALGSLLWLTGEVSARLFGGSWPRVSVADRRSACHPLARASRTGRAGSNA